MSWPAPDKMDADTGWPSSEQTLRILGEHPQAAENQLPEDHMVKWARTCAARVRNMRNELHSAYVGMSSDESAEVPAGVGNILDWLIAALIARENTLLLGKPGVAKTEIAVRIFELLGLSPPTGDDAVLQGSVRDAEKPWTWWGQKCKKEGRSQKYFHYLLSRFTQPEELFGPIEISLLRQGVLVRVNFGLLTGPGVRAAFLDEVFKASSSILNTLLTLTQERRYFNWGGMQRSDLAMLIGASNEMPGGFASGTAGAGGGGEDFQTLYAFLDRFPVRLLVPLASGLSGGDETDNNLSKAFDVAMRREGHNFEHGKHFERMDRKSEMPCINDILFLGRCCYRHEALRGDCGLFSDEDLNGFRGAFKRIARTLQPDGTEPTEGRITWSVSPRKLRALYKVALAHALVCDDGFAHRATAVKGPCREDLHVYDLIWDCPMARGELSTLTRGAIADSGSRLRPRQR